MAPVRTNENVTPFGRFLDKHRITYAEAARDLGVTRERVRQLAQRLYPSLMLAFVIFDWSNVIDPDAPVTIESWREVAMTSNEAKELARARAAAAAEARRPEPPPAPAPRPRRSRLRR